MDDWVRRTRTTHSHLVVCLALDYRYEDGMRTADSSVVVRRSVDSIFNDTHVNGYSGFRWIVTIQLTRLLNR